MKPTIEIALAAKVVAMVDAIDEMTDAEWAAWINGLSVDEFVCFLRFTEGRLEFGRFVEECRRLIGVDAPGAVTDVSAVSDQGAILSHPFRADMQIAKAQSTESDDVIIHVNVQEFGITPDRLRHIALELVRFAELVDRKTPI